MKTLKYKMPSPDLGDHNIIETVCGLRPCRHGGLRIEVEQTHSKTIIHNYGHGGCGVTISFGTAEIAADLVEKTTSTQQTIAVLGTGVVGLTTALELLQRGYQVKLYSHLETSKSTSILAGALWLPVGIEFGTSDLAIQQKIKILKRSLHGFKTIDRKRFGIEELPIYEPENSSTEEGLFGELFEHDLIQPPVDINSFPFQCDAEPGRVFQTDYIHTHIFLQELESEARQLGGEFHTQEFLNIDDVLKLEQEVLVNCLALGSQQIFNDQNLYSARGVLVHMKPQNLGYCVHDGYKYMFPRKDALILGGCFQIDQWDERPDEMMINEILHHHRNFFGQS
ncbi:MAG: FAD-dependent oxidoreductase [Phycisphaerales bacterium]|nr:FAD-dependent oxidoreductase [Phycisphaerales bacterium]